MAKKIESKLDRYAEALAEMERDTKTLKEMQAWLADEGVAVDQSTISRFLESQRQLLLQEKLLGQIASGAKQCQEVEKEFGEHPAPELETLIKLQRVILLNLSTQANANPEMLELIGNSFKAVLTAEKLKLQREVLTLDRDKFQFDAAKAALAAQKELKAISTSKLSDVEKIRQAHLALFGSLPETK
jgi:hypothetical protein